MQNVRRAETLLFLLVISLPIQLAAQNNPRDGKPNPNVKSAPIKSVEQYAPYWTSEPGWTTELRLRNNLDSRDLKVTPVLRTPSGREVSLDEMTIRAKASASVFVNGQLLKRAPDLLSEPGSYGSVLFRFDSADARNLYADAIVKLGGGPIEFHVNAYPTVDSAEWPRANSAGSREGIWSQPRSSETDLLIVGNSSPKTLEATLWLSDAAGNSWSRPLNLRGHETQRLDFSELLRASGFNGNYGGIKLEVPSNAAALHTLHLLYDETTQVSYSPRIVTRDPLAKLSERMPS